VARTQTQSIFSRGVFSSPFVNAANVVAISLACLIVYTPGLQTVTGATKPDQLAVVYASLIAWAGLWGWTEARKAITRHLNRTGRRGALFNRIFVW